MSRNFGNNPRSSAALKSLVGGLRGTVLQGGWRAQGSTGIGIRGNPNREFPIGSGGPSEPPREGAVSDSRISVMPEVLVKLNHFGNVSRLLK